MHDEASRVARNVVAGQSAGPVVQSGSVFGGVHVHSAPQSTAVPRQLPMGSWRFTGRAEELGRLDATLRDTCEAVVISAINGTAGIGKTALALYWAHQVADRFPDGQLYVNLCGYGPTDQPVTSEECIRSFLDAFGIAPERIPVDSAAQAGLYRSILADRRVLIVLDNARNTDQVRPLLPGSGKSTVIITSRNSLAGLAVHEGALRLTLDLFDVDEANELLAQHLGRERVERESPIVEEVIEACGRLPLALTIAAVRMAERPTASFRALIDELTAERDRLAGFDTGDISTNLRAVFSWSYKALSPPAARLFRMLGLQLSSSVGLLAVASLMETSPARVRTWLNELTRGHLLFEYEPNRYRFHDLLREYSASLGAEEDTSEDRELAQVRLVHHYMHSSRNAGVLIDPHGERSPLPVLPGVAVQELANYRQAMAWSAAEHSNLVAAVYQAVHLRQDVLACQMAAELCSYLDRSSHWRDWAATQGAVLHSARRRNDHAVEADVLRYMGWAHARLGEYETALDYLAQALTLSAQVNNPINEARIRHATSWTLGKYGRYEQALLHAQRTFELYQESGEYAAREALALNYIGHYHALLKQHQQALEASQEAYERFAGLNDVYGQAVALDSLGLANHGLAQFATAMRCYEQAAAFWQELDAPYNHASSLIQWGHTQHAAGEHDEAQRTWDRALAIFDERQHPDADALRDTIKRLVNEG